MIHDMCSGSGPYYFHVYINIYLFVNCMCFIRLGLATEMRALLFFNARCSARPAKFFFFAGPFARSCSGRALPARRGLNFCSPPARQRQVPRLARLDTWRFLQLGGPFDGCPHKKSPTVLGSMLRTPNFWKLPYGIDTWASKELPYHNCRIYSRAP